MTTFKIGDTVRLPLTRPDTHRLSPGWTNDMNKYLGIETTITHSTTAGWLYITGDNGDYSWHPDWLTLVSETIPETTNKVLSRSLKLEKAFKDRQKNKKTIKPIVTSIDRYPLSF